MTKKWAKWQRRCLRAQGPQYQGAATSECCHSTQKHRAQGSDEETRPGWLLSARTRNTVYSSKIKCSIEVFSWIMLKVLETTFKRIPREHRKAFLTHSHRIFSEHILSRLVQIWKDSGCSADCTKKSACVCVRVQLCESVQYVLSGRTCTILYHPTTAQTLACFSMRSQRSFSKVGLHSLHLQRHVAPKYGRNWESLKTFCFSACHSLTCYFCQWQKRHLPLMLVTCWDSCC